MITDMIQGLSALSDELCKPMERGVSTTTTLHRAIRHVFRGSSFTDVEIDVYEGAVYATLRFKDRTIDGSMAIRFEPGCDLELVYVAYDGGMCQSFDSIPVPEFIETLATLEEEEFFSDGNNCVPLDSDGKKLLDLIRQIGRERLVE
jgi:hypothetical protein